MLSHFSCVRLCATPETAAHQGCPIPGILQARTLEWVAISFSNAWKWKVKVKSLSRVRLLATPWTAAHQAPPSMGFSRQEYWSGVPLPSPISDKWTHLLQSPPQFWMYYCNSIFSLGCLFWALVIPACLTDRVLHGTELLIYQTVDLVDLFDVQADSSSAALTTNVTREGTCRIAPPL